MDVHLWVLFSLRPSPASSRCDPLLNETGEGGGGGRIGLRGGELVPWQFPRRRRGEYLPFSSDRRRPLDCVFLGVTRPHYKWPIHLLISSVPSVKPVCACVCVCLRARPVHSDDALCGSWIQGGTVRFAWTVHSD